jgi:hypothetical protein
MYLWGSPLLNASISSGRDCFSDSVNSFWLGAISPRLVTTSALQLFHRVASVGKEPDTRAKNARTRDYRPQTPPRTGYGLAGAPLQLFEKDSMPWSRKLGKGMEHRQDFHLVVISHLDQDFKVRASATLSDSCLCRCFLIRSLPTSHTSLDISPAF